MSKSVLVIMLCILLLCSCNSKQSDTNTNGIPAVKITWDKFSMGVDLSFVNEIQDYGGVYRDSGKVKDPYLILKDHGANTVRIRLWYNPQWIAALTGGKLYSDLADAERSIRRAKTLGMAVNLDIHYSDTWADPANQKTPAAWDTTNLAVLKDSVYQYTLRILNYLKSKNLTPEMVQVGNETNSGMLYPLGKVQNNNWQAFGILVNSGIKAIRDFSASSDIKPEIILHVAQLQNATYWVNNIMINGKVTDFDVLGISHYSKWSTVNTMTQVTSIIKNIRVTYGKQVMIVETAYPWTGGNADSYPNIISITDTVAGYPATRDGQYRYLKDLTQAIITAGGKGIMYWEPAWITSSMPDKWGKGSAWDNCTLFDFTGNSLSSADYLSFSYKF
jgi:arabinogalactan endo-1,4-beta-galactosidase